MLTPAPFHLRDKRILITGGSGFVGAALAQHFAAANQVYSLQRRDVPENKRIPEVRYLSGDVRTYEGAGLPERLDVVIHSAALLDAWKRELDPPNEALHAVNCSGTLRMLELARERTAERFIFISSAGVYGTGSRPHRESDPLHPINFYLLSKQLAESLVQWYATYFSVVLLRYSMPYGPGTSHPLLRFLLSQLKSGNPIRCSEDGAPHVNPVHIIDAVQITEQACSLEGNHTLNVAGPESITRIDLVKMLAGYLNITPVIERTSEGYGEHRLLDIAKLREVLNYQFKVTLAEGMEDFVLNS